MAWTVQDKKKIDFDTFSCIKKEIAKEHEIAGVVDG